VRVQLLQRHFTISSLFLQWGQHHAPLSELPYQPARSQRQSYEVPFAASAINHEPAGGERLNSGRLMSQIFKREQKTKNYAGSEKPLPKLNKERSHFDTGYCKTPPTKNKKK